MTGGFIAKLKLQAQEQIAWPVEGMDNMSKIWLPPLMETDTQSPSLIRAYDKLVKKRKVPSVNLPALARRDVGFMSTWVADPGKIFVSSDFSSLEPSISAHFSQDRYYRYATYDGIGKLPYFDSRGVLMIDDVYLMTASVMPMLASQVREFFTTPGAPEKWLEDAEACKEHPLLKGPRKQAKPCCLGFNYGMGPKKFVNMSYDAGSFVTFQDAKDMYKAYWGLFTQLRWLTKALEEKMKRSESLVNPFGYRLVTEPHKAYNAFIQSSASGVVDVYSLKFFERCPQAEFVCFIHDEVIYQIPEEYEEVAREATKECITSLNQDLNFTVPMRLGFKTGKSFIELK